MLRLMLIGKNGQLGWELQRALATLGEVSAFDFPEIDLGKPESLRQLIREKSPHIIINAAAYTNVDKAEIESDLAKKVNAESPRIIAEEAVRLNAAFIHYSTDFVFDGKKGSEYLETDIPNPLNTYGKTKLEGEQEIKNSINNYLIFRTSWVYSLHQGGFVTKILQWARQQEIMRIVDDQFGSPTWARLLAEITAQVIAQGRSDPIGYIQEKKGLYHLAGNGFCNRYEWTKKILEYDPNKEQQIVKVLLPSKTKDFKTDAIRPQFSSLNCEYFYKIFHMSFPDWKISLLLALNN